MQLNFKGANQYLPFILLVGLGIGTTNYFIHGDYNWLQWVIQASVTSLIIGYTLLWLASNKIILKHYTRQKWKLYSLLFLLFFLVGIIATEIEALIKTLIFQGAGYVPFSSIDNYIPNSVIAIFLGFSFFLNERLFSKKNNIAVNSKGELADLNNTAKEAIITKIPVKQGENIQLIGVQDIVYFEAYDNYAHLFLSSGKKMLCDYSLIFLENRLDKDFLRIHRKYIVNTRHIQQIVPHLNGRYVIRFNQPKLDTITSSKGYLKAIRKLIKIE
ncbi:MAG: LytR/AlgR family response regulator transcription factor [Flavobacteriaceae bacterium]